MRSWSLRGRLTLAVVSIVGLVLVGFAAALFFAVKSAAWDQHEAGLLSRAVAIASGTEHDEGVYELALPPDPVDARPTYVMAWTPDRTVLARSQSLAAAGASLACCRAADGPPQFFDIELPDGRRGRAVEVHERPREERGTPSPAPITLVLAEGTEDVEAAGAAVRTRFLVLGAIVLALFAGVTAWLMARVQAGMARERRFTADVSHELRTPLAGLRTLLEVSARSPRPEDAASALAIVVQMCTLVENLLMLARLDAHQIEIARDPVRLRSLVDECWRPYAAAAAARGITIENQLPDDATATTDRDKLRIILGNLLSNAAEYTEDRGWIRIAAPPGALLEVADSGPRIADPEKIFERMWRGDAARSATGIHCGIGLSLARSLAGVLGLALTCRSGADGSVRFVLSSARA